MKITARLLIGLAAPMSLAGCITPYPDLSQTRSPCRSEPGGWCGFVREIAAESYGYAMLSTNAYRDDETFTALPKMFQKRESEPNNDAGLAYSIFDRFDLTADGERGDLSARIIAFRGTDGGSIDDLLAGPFGDQQMEDARAVYLEERSQLDQSGNANIPIEVTGHSLGGALATQISIENAGVEAFIFNSSPFYEGNPSTGDSRRVSVIERGEFLRLLRRYKASPSGEVLTLNCAPSSTITEKHSIRDLAECLTWIAAYEDAAAAELLAPNMIGKPEVECGEADKQHPGPADGAVEPCTHQPKNPKDEF